MPQSKYFLGEWKDVADGEFVVARAFPVAGEVQAPGTPFEKDGIDGRRLKQLYEARYITPRDSDLPGLGGTVERELKGDATDLAASPSEGALEAFTGDSTEEVAERYEDEPTDAEEPVVNSATEPELREGDEAAPVSDIKEDTETEKQPKRTGTVVEGKAGWFHVEDGEGNKVGKSTRDEEEAKENLELYLLGENFEE
jgi:hypothetical protein